MLARFPVLKEHVTLGAVVPEFGAQLGFVARRLFSKGLVRALVGASLWHGGCALLAARSCGKEAARFCITNKILKVK